MKNFIVAAMIFGLTCLGSCKKENLKEVSATPDLNNYSLRNTLLSVAKKHSVDFDVKADTPEVSYFSIIWKDIFGGATGISLGEECNKHKPPKNKKRAKGIWGFIFGAVSSFVDYKSQQTTVQTQLFNSKLVVDNELSVLK